MYREYSPGTPVVYAIPVPFHSYCAYLFTPMSLTPIQLVLGVHIQVPLLDLFVVLSLLVSLALLVSSS